MAFVYNFLAIAFVIVSIAVQSLATLSRRELRTAPGHRDEYPLIPPLGSQHYGSQGSNDLELLNIVLLASVDGSLHALDRSTGTILWSMSSNSLNSPSALSPLVRTQQAVIFDDEGDDSQQEYYVIEPQSGDIYVMSSKSEPLQRLPFSMSTLVDMTPFRLSGEEDSKTFIGRKETSLLLIELETGRIKQTISSECPWNEYRDPFEDLKEAEGELDSDEQDGVRPPRKPTEIFVGRTDYHITIRTSKLPGSSSRPPEQYLSFSTYGPNNQDNGYQMLYRKTPDDVYIQSSSNGMVMSFKIPPDEYETPKQTTWMWGMSFSKPVVAVLDVVKTSGRQNPMVLLQPSPRLQDVFPSVDLSNAAKLNHQLPNLDSAYVGILEETGSLFVMSSDHFPLVAFGDANPNSMHPLIDPPPGTSLPTGTIPKSSVDEITKARKLRELCDKSAFDPRCLTGIRKLEPSSRSRLSRLLDAAPVAQTPQPTTQAFPTSSSIEGPGDNGSLVNILSPWPHGQAPGQNLWSNLPLWLLVLSSSILGWIMIGRNRWKLVKIQDPAQSLDVHHEVEPKYVEQTLPIDTIAPERPPDHLELPEANNGPTDDDLLPHESVPMEEIGESEKEDPIAAPTRKKPLRRRRGKKKKGPNLTTPPDNDEPEGETETDVAIDVSEEGSGKIQLIVPNPVTVAAPSPALIVSEEILGFGSHGTVVFKGSLQGRAVAVKRLLQDFVTLATREVSILEESDDHPNVIRYFYQEAQSNFLYIAIELCPASLADIIERPDNFMDIAVAFDPKRALRQITSGLRHLHALKIIHRDIKPQNILVSSAKNGQNHRMLISDFGLCKRLEVDQTSFMPTAFGAMAAGTVGWRAPEILRGEVRLDDSDGSQSSRGSVATLSGSNTSSSSAKPTKLTKAVDIFALGCLFYYCLTRGSHPYGDRFEREVNIMKDIKSLGGLDHFGEEGTEVTDLIEKMLNPQAALRYVEWPFLQDDSERIFRPDTTSCLVHPFFWDAERRLGFLQDASDRFEIMCREPREKDLVTLETNASNVVGQDWRARLDKSFQENLGKFRKYDGKSVQDLLRALRNKKHHYQDLPENLRRQLHPIPEGYLAYFTRRFPLLFMHVHSVVASSALRHEAMFRSYFDLNEH
ncbi:hypothetical protein BDM02DRAFT_1648160 [Thelephora ganbajun]|uniref:Uncharacterized protein n=1 Tax=Thelephora ganbajun TaxID=370292 RepID=A0ACB6ZX42_THEGA|nr:hypothetical protein BDM02DRAFT_1648160 [Thelephora ganbajun]